MNKIIQVKKPLHVDFTGEEIEELNKNILESVRLKDEAEAELQRYKLLASDVKSRIKALGGEISRDSALIRAGGEIRMVPCEKTLDFDMGTAMTVRLDTGEIVEDRKLLPDERQMGLRLVDDEPGD